MRRESDTLHPGDRAPDFTLHDANGHAHSLKDLLAERADVEGRPLQTVVLVFDRGTW
jgi:peroxiredoxin